MPSKLLFKAGDNWTPQILRDTLDALTDIAYNDLGLALTQNEVVVVSEQGMIDAYANGGMKTMYPHWSFGLRAQELRRRIKSGQHGLAYEMIVPGDPTPSWNLSSNSGATMATVLAHAAVGHNAVFTSNHLYRQHTKPGLAKYCEQMRDFVLLCEKKYGVSQVESVIDVCHMLSLPCGVFRYGEPHPFNMDAETKRVAKLMNDIESSIDLDMVGAVPGFESRFREQPEVRENSIRFPETNILYFLETYGPILKTWERELIRMLRNYAQQTMLPGVQVKALHEGSAMFFEGYLLRKLYEDGRLDDGTWFEMIHLNQGVLRQGYMRETGRLEVSANPYALGLGMFNEIVRVAQPKGNDAKFFQSESSAYIDCNGPTTEERKMFSLWAGTGQWRDVLKDAIANYHDASFIEQFLTPRLVREWGMAVVRDEGPHYRVTAIQDDEGFYDVRRALADSHSFDGKLPRIEISDVDFDDDRILHISYYPRNEMKLSEDDVALIELHLESAWGFDVEIEAVIP